MSKMAKSKFEEELDKIDFSKFHLDPDGTPVTKEKVLALKKWVDSNDIEEGEYIHNPAITELVIKLLFECGK